MPVIPAQTEATVAPTGAPGTFHSVDANPAQFGALSAQAMGNVGQSLDRAGDVAAQAAIHFQKQYNETASDAALMAFDANARQVKGDFKDMRGADAMNARDSTLQKIEGLRQDTRAQLKNPEQQRMFDYMSRRAAKGYLDEVDTHARTESKVWMGEVAKGSIENEQNKIADDWGNNEGFARGIGNIKIQTRKLLQLKGIDPDSDAGKAEITHQTGAAWDARLTSIMKVDADLAGEMLDANGDQIDAKHRAVLSSRIESARYTQLMRDVALGQRAEANAQREMRQTQASTFASLMADEATGKRWDMQHISDLVRSQQLPEHALTAVDAWRRRAQDAPSNPRTLATMTAALYDPDNPLTVKDVIGRAGRDLHGSDAAHLINAINAKERKGENAVDRANFNEVKTALSGHAIEQGIIRDQSQLSDMTALWAQAQHEWTDRVLVKGEASNDVKEDILNRYSRLPQVPAAWPRPRMGNITSSQDIPKVMQATRAAIDRGEITKAQGEAEGSLILKYDNFYRSQDARLAAAKAKQVQNGDRAKLKGATAAPSGSE